MSITLFVELREAARISVKFKLAGALLYFGRGQSWCGELWGATYTYDVECGGVLSQSKKLSSPNCFCGAATAIG